MYQSGKLLVLNGNEILVFEIVVNDNKCKIIIEISVFLSVKLRDVKDG